MKPVFFFLLILTIHGCATSNTDVIAIDSNNIQAAGITQMQSKSVATLSGKWNLIPALPADTATGKIPFLNFDTNSRKMNGNTGCNNISGAYMAAGKSLSFSKNIISTRMACPGYDEAAFMKNLLRVNGYEIRGDTLELMADTAPLSYWLKGK